LDFSSDNVTGVAPEIMEAIARANTGSASSYGADAWTARLQTQFSTLFEHAVVVAPVINGTAANALALSTCTPPWGAVVCYAGAHINGAESNAPEFFSGGKMVPLPGERGKITPESLDALLGSAVPILGRPVHTAISISQATDVGAVYSPAEVAALSHVAKNCNLTVHMDGARLANAIAHLRCAPGDITWRAGVDVLSFGSTKNGALAAEAVVFFNTALAKDFEHRRKRSGHTLPKMRFVSAQLEAYVKDGVWLRNAAHANAAASRLGRELADIPGVVIKGSVDANIVFAEMPSRMIEGLHAAGFGFFAMHGWARLVTSFNTNDEVVALFIETAKHFGQAQ
jgi:threonine aldolase